MKDLRKSLTACLLGLVLLFGGCAMFQDAAGKFRLNFDGIFNVGGEERESDDDRGDE